MTINGEDKIYADLWVKQSDLFLKLVALIPAVELGIAAGWYALQKDQQPHLARFVGIIGAIVMAASVVIFYRTAIYIGHFREKIGNLLPSIWPSGITGRLVGILIPALCLAINILLASGYVELSSPTPTQPTGKAASCISN